MDFRQWGQTSPSASDGARLTSRSQDLHCRSIIVVMKPLISALVTIVAAVSVQAQTGTSPLIQAARKERERQAEVKSSIDFTDANSHGITGGNVTTATASPATKAAEAAEATAAKTPATAPDPFAVRDENIRKMREKIMGLEDQVTAMKLQINDFTNQVYAPVTTMIEKNEAQANLGKAQGELLDLETELSHRRDDLQDLLNSPVPGTKE